MKRKAPTYRELHRQNTVLTGQLDSQCRTADSLRASEGAARYNYNAALETIKKLEAEIRWYKQLSQNLSEAVCAYMRSRG